MMRILAVAAVMAVLTGQAFALELASARASGQVCEKGDGYIAATGAAGGEVAALVKNVNDGRRSEYARISQQNGQPTEVVAKVAVEPILAKGAKLCK